MSWAAGDRPCIEMGSRRTHERAAVAAARAAYVAGFTASSNLRARLEYGVPTAGTSAHSFTLLHDTEEDAFRAQVHSLGKGTTLLVDTYDIAEAVRLGVEVAGPDLGAVRIDSGDLGLLAYRVRAQLDELGATQTQDHRDLRPRRVRDRGARRRRRSTGTAWAPSWSPAAATRPAASSTSWSPARTPTAELVGVAKKSKDKISIGGRKYALRRLSADGVAQAEVIGIGQPAENDGDDRPLLVPLVRDGEVVGVSRSRPLGSGTSRSRAELPLVARQLSKGEPVIETRFEGYWVDSRTSVGS